jgi:hypothetical protein
MQEAWLAILPEWLNAAGAAPSGYDLHGLGDELSALTGAPNPFPAPPVPPAPPLPLDPVDAALAAVGDHWVTQAHTDVHMRRAYQAWRAQA